MNQTQTQREKWNRWAGYALGTGIVLFLVHTPWQPGMTYDPVSQTYSGVFLPALGIALVIGTAFAVLIRDGEKQILSDVGPKWTWMPLIVIVASMFARLTVEPTMKTLSSAFLGVILFAVYLAARKLGASLFKPITVAVVVEALSCIVIGLFVEPGIRTGGIISFPARNYAVAGALLILGTTVSVGRWQWFVTSIAVAGLLFIGSGEAVLACAILLVVALIRRDWGTKVLVVGASVLITVAVLLITGAGKDLYHPAADKIRTVASGDIVGEKIVPGNAADHVYPRNVSVVIGNTTYTVHYEHEWEATLDNALFWRWSGWKRAVENTTLLGHGFELTKFDFYTVHNVPLIVADQIGPLAALAWLFLMIAGLVKTKWKYAFVAILSLSLLDHMAWTLMAFLPWGLLGVATAPGIQSDLVFRKETA